jgi:AraC family transcriptional regulator
LRFLAKLDRSGVPAGDVPECGAMNRIVPLVRTAAVTLEQFDHEPGIAHHDPDRERARGYAVSFVESGSFRVRTGGAWQRLGPDQLFVTRPGLEFSCAHDDDHPADACLSVSYTDAAIESLRSGGVHPAGTVVPALTNRRAYLRLALRGCGPGDDARIEALAGALQWSLSRATAPTKLFRPERLAWYAARIERATAMIETHYADPLSLSVLARESGMSVYHFARVFNELQGQPPHRFLTAVRLRAAQARLRDGAPVTETCFAVGFGSLSHFVTTFRRRYGIRPSAANQTPAAVSLARAPRS